MTLADCIRLAKNSGRPVELDADKQEACVTYPKLGVVYHEYEDRQFLDRVITRMKRMKAV